MFSKVERTHENTKKKAAFFYLLDVFQVRRITTFSHLPMGNIWSTDEKIWILLLQPSNVVIFVNLDIVQLLYSHKLYKANPFSGLVKFV